ncbi:unnamed protein product [Gordionus sp. m RMFG-2023]
MEIEEVFNGLNFKYYFVPSGSSNQSDSYQNLTSSVENNCLNSSNENLQNTSLIGLNQNFADRNSFIDTHNSSALDIGGSENWKSHREDNHISDGANHSNGNDNRLIKRAVLVDRNKMYYKDKNGVNSGNSAAHTIEKKSLKASMQENKNSLKNKLMMRRPMTLLIEQGIIPPLQTPVSIYERKQKLERAKTGDFLNHKIQRRPERAELIQQHILEDTVVDPHVAEKQKTLKRARLIDNLNDRLSRRPGPIDLVMANYLILPSNANDKNHDDERELKNDPYDHSNFTDCDYESQHNFDQNFLDRHVTETTMNDFGSMSYDDFGIDACNKGEQNHLNQSCKNNITNDSKRLCINDKGGEDDASLENFASTESSNFIINQPYPKNNSIQRATSPSNNVNQKAVFKFKASDSDSSVPYPPPLPLQSISKKINIKQANNFKNQSLSKNNITHSPSCILSDLFNRTNVNTTILNSGSKPKPTYTSSNNNNVINKLKTIKFHEYKGPPCTSPGPSLNCNSFNSSSLSSIHPTNKDSNIVTNDSYNVTFNGSCNIISTSMPILPPCSNAYDLLLRQQKLFLQLQLECQQQLGLINHSLGQTNNDNKTVTNDNNSHSDNKKPQTPKSTQTHDNDKVNKAKTPIQNYYANNTNKQASSIFVSLSNTGQNFKSDGTHTGNNKSQYTSAYHNNQFRQNQTNFNKETLAIQLDNSELINHRDDSDRMTKNDNATNQSNGVYKNPLFNISMSNHTIALNNINHAVFKFNDLIDNILASSSSNNNHSNESSSLSITLKHIDDPIYVSNGNRLTPNHLLRVKERENIEDIANRNDIVSSNSNELIKQLIFYNQRLSQSLLNRSAINKQAFILNTIQTNQFMKTNQISQQSPNIAPTKVGGSKNMDALKNSVNGKNEKTSVIEPTNLISTTMSFPDKNCTDDSGYVNFDYIGCNTNLNKNIAGAKKIVNNNLGRKCPLEILTVPELRSELKKRKLPVSGPKPYLLERLKSFVSEIIANKNYPKLVAFLNDKVCHDNDHIGKDKLPNLPSGHILTSLPSESQNQGPAIYDFLYLGDEDNEINNKSNLEASKSSIPSKPFYAVYAETKDTLSQKQYNNLKYEKKTMNINDFFTDIGIMLSSPNTPSFDSLGYLAGNNHKLKNNLKQFFPKEFMTKTQKAAYHCQSFDNRISSLNHNNNPFNGFFPTESHSDDQSVLNNSNNFITPSLNFAHGTSHNIISNSAQPKYNTDLINCISPNSFVLDDISFQNKNNSFEAKSFDIRSSTNGLPLNIMIKLQREKIAELQRQLRRSQIELENQLAIASSSPKVLPVGSKDDIKIKDPLKLKSYKTLEQISYVDSPSLSYIEENIVNIIDENTNYINKLINNHRSNHDYTNNIDQNFYHQRNNLMYLNDSKQTHLSSNITKYDQNNDSNIHDSTLTYQQLTLTTQGQHDYRSSVNQMDLNDIQSDISTLCNNCSYDSNYSSELNIYSNNNTNNDTLSREHYFYNDQPIEGPIFLNANQYTPPEYKNDQSTINLNIKYEDKATFGECNNDPITNDLPVINYSYNNNYYKSSCNINNSDLLDLFPPMEDLEMMSRALSPLDINSLFLVGGQIE